MYPSPILSFQEMRRRRAEGSVELRKAKKDQCLMKRRNIAEDAEDQENAAPIGEGRHHSSDYLPPPS